MVYAQIETTKRKEEKKENPNLTKGHELVSKLDISAR